MKPFIPLITLLLCAAVLLNSCAVSNNSVNPQKPGTALAGESPEACFVQLNDGTIRHYSSLKLVTGILTTPHLVADDQVIINSKDIVLYQDKQHYAVSSRILTSTKKNSLVAVNTLPGFAIKVLSGKLNVYCRKYYNGINSVEEYFLQQGQDGFIVAYSKEVMLGMLQEDKKAMEFFKSNSRISPRSKRILATVEMYNNNQFITKN